MSLEHHPHAIGHCERPWGAVMMKQRPPLSGSFRKTHEQFHNDQCYLKLGTEDCGTQRKKWLALPWDAWEGFAGGERKGQSGTDTDVEGQGLEEVQLIRLIRGGHRELEHSVEGWRVTRVDVGKQGHCQMWGKAKAFGLNPVENGMISR